MNALRMLEELLSLTEPVKDRLSPPERRRWHEISAATADMREKVDEETQDRMIDVQKEIEGKA